MLRNRPAAFVCLVFATGMAAGLFLKFCGVLVVSALLAVFLAVRHFCGKRLLPVLLALVSLLFGCLYAAAYTSFTSPPMPKKGEVYGFTAAVKNISVYDDGVRAELTVQDKSSAFDGRDLYMYLGSSHPTVCDVVRVSASLAESGMRAKSNGVDYMAYGSYEILSGKKPQGPYFKIIALRQRVSAAADRAFTGEAAGFYRALITGDRSGVGTDTNASFSRSGVLHILAVSGLHFSIVIMGLYRLLIKTVGRKRLCSVICICAAAVYALFTGFSPSVLRAAVMCCAVFAANIFKGKSDPIINLGLALAALLLFRPYAVLNTSLLLSFLATAGIVFVLPQLDGFYNKTTPPAALKWFITPSVLSVSASVFCMPVYLLGFDYVSLCSPLTNIFVGVLAGPALVLGVAATALSAVGIGFAARVGELLFMLLRFISDSVSGFRYSCISLHTPYIWLLIVPSFITAAVFCAFRVKKGLLVLSCSAAATVLICFCCYVAMINGYKNAPLLYLHDGADDLYAIYHNGKSAVLIDGGGDSGASDGAAFTGVAYLDAYVVTDCTESALQRLKKTFPYVPADTVYLPVGEGAEDIAVYLAKRGAEVRFFDACEGLNTADTVVYGGIGELADNPLIIKTQTAGRTVLVFGRGGGFEAALPDRCDALIVTRACTAYPCDPDLIPLDCGKAFIYEHDKSFLTDYIENLELSDGICKYKGELSLRFGDEVKAYE